LSTDSTTVQIEFLQCFFEDTFMYISATKTSALSEFATFIGWEIQPDRRTFLIHVRYSEILV